MTEKPFLRPARNAHEAEQRVKIIERAAKQAAAIEQIFTGTASWNENRRQPNQAPIDCDPDGELARALAFLRRFAKEANG